ncbi:MAG: hypothetical protein H0T46_30500 [Deltaproteobacteria bacterium]|nr:hypothetical protein [Deltaproteobacteria bacterium]
MGSLKDQLLAKGLASKTAPATKAVAPAPIDPAAAHRAREEEAAAAAHASHSPRYPGARIATLAEARELFEPRAYDLRNLTGDVDGAVDIETLFLPSVQVIEGDVALDELRMTQEGSNLYVLGDLTITGRLLQPFRSNALVVFGSLRAHHVVTGAELLVFGDLEVARVLYGNCTNHATNVLGTARVGTLVSCKQHMFSFWGPRAIGELVRRHTPPNFEVYGIAPGIRTGRLIDPTIGDPYDEASIAAALHARDDIFVAP